MSNHSTIRHYIGPVGQLFGRSYSTAQRDADMRDIRHTLFSDGDGFLLPDISLNIPLLIDRRVCLVHRTNGQIDGVIFYENIDVTHSRFGSSNHSVFRITALRSLAVAKGARRGYIAYRLVREAQLRGAIFSPHEDPELPPLRSVACLAAIHANNSKAIDLAHRMGAIVGSTDSAVVDHHPAIRGYAVQSHEKAHAFDKNADFVIAVLKSTDLLEAARLHRIGALNGATHEGTDKIIVKYDPGDILPDLLTGAVSGLVNNDKALLNRLGLDDGPDIQGLGTVHYSRITNEMLFSKAS